MSYPVGSLRSVDLTADQRRGVDHPGPRSTIVGGPGTGKTTALVARYRGLTRQLPPSRLLVLCPDRAAAQRFADAVLGEVQGGWDALPVTTAYRLACGLLRGAGVERRLLSSAEQRAWVRRLLAAEDRADWPVTGHLLGRAAFVGEVVSALPELLAAGHETAEAAGGSWAELARFGRRYAGSLEEAGAVDSSLLLAEAAGYAASAGGRFDHLLVDDADRLPVLAQRLVAALTADGLASTVTCQSVDAAAALASPSATELRERFRVASPGHLVCCGHPSMEPEAIAGELLAASHRGVAWSDMAVLVRRLGASARAIARALARHGLPVVPLPALAAEEPVVRAVLDLLRWLDDPADPAALERLPTSPLAGLDARTVREVRRRASSAGEPVETDAQLAPLVTLRDHLRARLAAGDGPADLAYEAWAKGLADLGGDERSALGAVDDRALDALVALVDGLRRFTERNPRATLGDVLAAVQEGGLVPDPWRVAASTGPEGVTITSIEASAGREWDTVVIAGCVEGELPGPRRAVPLFDPALLTGTAPPPEDRRRQLLAEERRSFDVATSRARSTLLATAAPQPGVLLSRFVEGWPSAPLRLPLAPGQPPPVRAVTASPVPVAPEGRLQLSATQLDTYDDCPLRYAYQYVLRAREEPGVHASLGSLVHQALAAFLDPESPLPRTFDRLMAVAAEVWQDDVARYRPQVEEARRDFVAMLTAWWEQEGSREDLGPDVLAVERRFRFEVGPHSVTGAIDRIDRADDGAGIRVVDYKTGKREPAPNEVADDLQLAVYHLAATRDPELAALGPPRQLQLRYLRSMHTYHQPVTDDLAATTEQRVLATAERVLAEDFAPSVRANCRTCSFHRLCPLQPEGRQVRPA